MINMKKTVIAILFSFYSVLTLAQSPFFKYYPTDKDEYINHINELPNGNFLISGGQTESGQNRQAYLLLIDSIGNKITEKSHPISDTSSIYVVPFFLPNETNTINIFNLKSIETVDGFKSVVSLEKINTESLITFYKKDFYTTINQSYIPERVSISDSLIFLQSTIRDYPSLFFSGTLVSSYDCNFDSIASYQTQCTMAIGLLIDTIDKKVKNYTSTGIVSVVKLNYDLSIIDSISLATYAPPSALVVPLSNNKHIMTFMADNELNPKQHIKAVSFSNQDIAIDSAEYWNNPDSLLFPGFRQNTILKGDTLFIVGFYKSIPSQFPYQNEPTYIQITKLDTNMNVISHNFFGGDAVYFPFKIIETSKGGLLVTGVRYDQTNPTIQQFHPFALNLTPDLTLSIGENDTFIHSAIVFPNPGGDQINLTSGIQLMKASFILFDISGKMIFKRKITAAEMQFDVPFLVSGSYVWQIVLNNKVLETGKWIKK